MRHDLDEFSRQEPPPTPSDLALDLMAGILVTFIVILLAVSVAAQVAGVASMPPITLH